MTAAPAPPSVVRADSVPTEHAPVLRIDLGAIRLNYLEMRRRYQGRVLSAVVKSDGYGLGLEPLVKVLVEAGCKAFWVNDLHEAIRVRSVAGEADIYTLMGLGNHRPRDFEAIGAIPALAGLDEVEHCAGHALAGWRPMPVAIQIDTGLGRLGLGHEELAVLSSRRSMLARLDIRLWVSHLASYNLPDDPANREQRSKLVNWVSSLPPAPVSLAASSCVFMASDWHFDVARVGSALFGVQTSVRWQNGLIPCYELSAPLIRVAHYPSGRRLGYRGFTELKRPSRIATAAIGYANGLPQRFAEFGTARLAGTAVPLVGGMAMNMSMLDITDVAGNVSPGGVRAIFLDRDQPIEPLAEQLGCTPNVLLTQIGAGTMKQYVSE